MVKMKETLTKAKAKYVKACADYEKATLELRAADPVGTKPKDMEKLRTKVANDKVAADQAHDAYKQQVAEHRIFQGKYEEQFRHILEQFGESEMKRREQIKEVLKQFMETQDHYARSMTETMIPLRTAIEALDSGADLQAQLEVKKTGQHAEPLVEYEPYVTDSQVDVPADPVGSGARANPPDLQRTRSKSMKPNTIELKAGAKDAGKKEEKDKKDKKEKKHKDEAAPPALVAPEDAASTSSTVEEKPKAKNEKKHHRSPSASEETHEEKSTENGAGATPVVAAATDAAAAAAVESNAETSPKAANGDEEKSEKADKKSKTPRTKRKDVKDKRAPIAKALFDYEATDETEINFSEGDLIIITLYDGEVPDCPGWMKGKCKGKEGLFPANHAEPYPEAKLCKATFDFEVSEPEELGLKEGELLIIEATHEDWYEGRNEKGETGIFPSTYVALL